MITKLTLENWKSFGEATVFFDPLTVLIGANDSGKSNLLEALWFLSQLPRARSLDAIFSDAVAEPWLRGGSANLVRFGQESAILTLEIDEELEGTIVRLRYSLTIAFTDLALRVSSESLTVIDETTGNLRRSVFVTKERLKDNPNLIASIWEGQRGRPRDRTFDATRPVLLQLDLSASAAPVKQCTSLVMSRLQTIRALDPQPGTMRTYAKRSYRLQTDGSNLAGYWANLPEREKEAVEQIVDQQLSALSEGGIKHVYAELILPLKADAVLLADTGADADDTPTAGNLLSDGTLRFLAIVVAVATGTAGSLLVLEEVDDGLHPARAEQLARFLREQALERGVDLLFTTHNASLLDRLGPEIVPFTYLVHRPKPGAPSTVTRIDDLARLPQLLGMGGVGAMAASGRLHELLD